MIVQISHSKAGGYMVAFAGRKYAARSLPAFVADNTHTITSFTLVSLWTSQVLLTIVKHNALLHQ